MTIYTRAQALQPKPRQTGYTATVSKEILLSSSMTTRPKAAIPHSLAASSFVPQFMAARWEARKGLPVKRSAWSRSANPSSRRPHLAVGASVLANQTTWRPIMAHSLSLPVRTSAQIIRHPNFSSVPVVQTKRRGRHPNSIASIWAHRVKKYIVNDDRIASDNELERARSYMQTCEFIFQDARGQYLVAQQHAARSISSPVSN